MCARSSSRSRALKVAAYEGRSSKVTNTLPERSRPCISENHFYVICYYQNIHLDINKSKIRNKGILSRKVVAFASIEVLDPWLLLDALVSFNMCSMLWSFHYICVILDKIGHACRVAVPSMMAKKFQPSSSAWMSAIDRTA